MANSPLYYLARFIAPLSCVACAAEGGLTCQSCIAALPLSPHPGCFGCGRYNHTGATCRLCRITLGVAGVTVAATYDGSVRRLIGRLKYQRQREAADILASRLAPLLDPANFDVVAAVPVATTRLRSRGYNQAELIGRRLAQKLHLPYRPLLRRTRNLQQVGSARAQRLRQADTVFVAKSMPFHQRVLLVDDVLTTGATLNACAKQLVIRNRACVWVAAAARREHDH